jgi:uncharacterized membrane protein HdeD (DUF308 family)
MNDTGIIVRNVQAGMYFGAFMAGAISGLMPLIAGLLKKRQRYAFVSWLLTTAAGFMAFFWFAVGAFCVTLPVAFFLMVVVLCDVGTSPDRKVSQETSGGCNEIVGSGFCSTRPYYWPPI